MPMPSAGNGAAAGGAAAASGASAPAPSPTRKPSAASRKKAAAGAPAAAGGTSVSMKKPADAAAEAAAAANAGSGTAGDQFARGLSVMSVAHVARGVGFDALQKSATDALVDIFAKYVQRIGTSAKDIAELAGRTQPRATDVVQALRDLEPAPVELQDLAKTLETAKRPFPRDVPQFPVRKRDLPGAAIEAPALGSRERLPPHVPSFLPPLPNRHTYSADSRTVVDRERDTKRVRLDMLGQKAQVQQSLHGLQSVAAKRAVAVVHQPSWSAFQGSTGDNATENPFVQAPIVTDNGGDAAEQSVFDRPGRAFAPSLLTHKTQKKSSHLESSSVTIPKLANNQELGKEEKILTGTFHDGDSE